MDPVELTARREALGLSIKAFSEVLDIRERSLTRWEAGVTEPRDWSWLHDALLGMEDYLTDLIDEMVTNADTVYEATGQIGLISYDSRGAFYQWHPDARVQQWPGAGSGVPVEMHRVASARAAVILRQKYGDAPVNIAAVPKP